MWFKKERSERELFEDRYHKPSPVIPISESIAYVRVCEWLKEPMKYPRPKMETLALAKNHAIRLDDTYILIEIQECVSYYRKLGDTPTPELPKSSRQAEQELEKLEISLKEVKRNDTQPYALTVPYRDKSDSWLD